MVNKIKNEYFISFLAAVLIAVIGFALAGASPFGEYSSAASDMRYQYLSFTAQCFNNLKKMQDPLISYNGLGTDIFAFMYIKDPINILFMFFDTKFYPEVYLFITIFKFGLTAAAMSFFLKKSGYVSLSGYSNVSLALLYAFCGFCISCIINVMFFANVILLPILLLSIEKIVDKNKAWLLFLIYFVCLYLDYYLAFVNGLFAACYFVFYACTRKQADLKSVFKSFLLCAAAAFMAAGACAVILLPCWMNISSNYVDVITEADIPFIEHSLNDIVKAFTLLPDTSPAFGGLNIYIGILPFVGMFCFLAEKEISKKERAAAFIFVLFMFAGFMLRPLYAMWHLFRQPVGFNGRFSYTVSFLLIVLTAKYIEKTKKSSVKICLAVLVFVLAAVIDGLVNSTGLWSLKAAGISAFFAVIYILLLIKDKKKAIFAVITAEAVFMCCCGINNQKLSDDWENKNVYRSTFEKTRNLVEKADENGLFRMTDVISDDTNMSAAVGYTSLETFSSFTDQKSSEKLFQLGICAPYDYREILNYSNSIVSEGLFGVKYIMASDPDSAQKDELGRTVYVNGGNYTSSQRLLSDNYIKISDDENGVLYKNKTAFPLMFAVNDEAINSSDKFYDKASVITGGYANQAVFLNDMFGTNYALYDICYMQPEEPVNADILPNGDHTLLKPHLSEGHSSALSADEVGYMSYSCKAEKDGDYVMDARFDFPFEAATSRKFNYIVNGAFINNVYNVNNQFFNTDIGSYKKDDIIRVTVRALTDINISAPLLLRLRYNEFKALYDKAQENSLKNIRLEKNMLKAETDFSEEKLVFTSFAYNDGFHIYADDSEIEKVKIADAFMGFRIPAGKHDICIKYMTPGLKLGAAISALFFAAAALLIYLNEKMMGE